MTIKDIEERTGMGRTNIRFYESEGLITPARRENGYRDYSEEDAQVLQKVKLLRMMDIPLEEVKALCAGTERLSAALERLEQTMDQRQLHLERTREAVQQMIREDAGFAELDPERYLPLMEDGTAWEGDVQPRLNLPWRRFWARSLDFCLYGFVAYLIFPSLLQDPLGVIYMTVSEVFLVLLLEPVFLTLVKTTPGKAVFGITVTDLDGRHLTYREAIDRTFLVLQHGLGFGVPYLGSYFHYKSLEIAEAGGELIWEQNSELTIQDSKTWRYGLFVLSTIVVLAYPAQKEYQRVFDRSGETVGFRGEDPFYHDYWVEEVLYGEEHNAEGLPLVRLEGYPEDTLQFHREAYISDNIETIGAFEYSPPEDRSTCGLWMLYKNEQTYRLQVDDSGSVFLDYLEYGELCWSWKLKRIGSLRVRFNADSLTNWSGIDAKWFYNGAFEDNSELIPFKTLKDSCVMSLFFDDEMGSSLTLIEERHEGDRVIVNEITLQADEYGSFKMDVAPDESATEVYAIYYVPYGAGEYIFGIIY